MGRVRFLAAAASVTALALLTLPASALAGTYTWSLPTDFTATAPGLNPDHDLYGARPWSYLEGTSSASPLPPPAIPSQFQPLTEFQSTILGGLSGWTDGSFDTGPDYPFVAENTGGSAVMNVAPGQLAIGPAHDRVAAVGWTSPLAKQTAVTVSGTVQAAGSGVCLGTGLQWTLVDEGGSAVASGTTTDPISATPTVSPGKTIHLTIDYTGTYSQNCDVAAVSLSIQATQATAPAVTLASPANGALISNGQPTFRGKADTGFGASQQVTVHVYQGTNTSPGNLILDLIANRANDGGYSVTPTAAQALADGTYTAQAEQDDLSTPPDAGHSSAVVFIVHNAPPSITLASPGSKPLHNSTPTLSGVAGTGPGDSDSVDVAIYPGANTRATPVRQMNGTVGAGGSYAVQVSPPLADGRYTAVALQGNSAGVGTSSPRTFRIKLHAPAVKLGQPKGGANVADRIAQFSGVAGTALGDSKQIEVLLYRGLRASGQPLGTLMTSAMSGSWTVKWPGRLALGLYTARAMQRDDAGNVGRSAAHTFLVVPTPPVIGKAVDLNAADVASVAINCPTPAGTQCIGNVTVFTTRGFQPVAGGPAGLLRVIFAYVTIPGGKTLIVRRPVSFTTARALRRAAPVPVLVTARLGQTPSQPTTFSAARRLEPES